MYICTKGDAWTPQRFWVCVTTENPIEVETLRRKGYVVRDATPAEVVRAKDKGKVCSFGKIADQFFQ